MDNQLIIAVVAGLVIFLGLWLFLRGRGAPPAKVEEKPSEAKPSAPVTIAEAEAPVAAKPAAKPARQAAAKPAARKPAAKKPKAETVSKAKPAARKPAARKAAAPSKAPVESVPPPLTAIGVPGAVGAPDNLLLLKGVGPKLNTLLGSLGITRFDQIGAWSPDDAQKVDAHLGAFKGRIERDSWIEQAGLLARGAIAEFETRFGKLDGEN